MAANNKVEWISSERGQPKLVIDDYMFVSNGKGRTPGSRYWKCSFKGCQVTAKTIGNNVMGLQGIMNHPDHGHVNDGIEVKNVELKVSKLCLFVHVAFDM
jgi:hypothetical protein